MKLLLKLNNDYRREVAYETTQKISHFLDFVEQYLKEKKPN